MNGTGGSPGVLFGTAPYSQKNDLTLEISRQSGRGIHSPAGIKVGECVAYRSMVGEGTPTKLERAQVRGSGARSSFFFNS